MRNVFVYGSFNIDLVFQINRLPVIGETYHAEMFSQFLGGKGANQCVAAAKLGATTWMMGHLGYDDFGQTIIHEMAKLSINLEGVQCVNMPTGLAVVQIVQGDNCIILSPGANFSHDLEKQMRCLKENAQPNDILLVQFEKQSDSIEKMLSLAKTYDMITVVNPAPMNVDLMTRIKRYVDILILNETEYNLLFSNDTFAQVDTTYQAIIVTLGKNGVKIMNADGISYLKGISVNAVDSTGAGDTFVGAFVNFYQENSDIISACEKANVCAALSVTKLGAQTGMPTRDEFTNFWESIQHKKY